MPEEKVIKYLSLYKKAIAKKAYFVVLKILSISKSDITETLNLRAGSHFNLNYSSNDVKWGNNGTFLESVNIEFVTDILHLCLATKQKVATAATNGAIILWDLNKIGRKAGMYLSREKKH